MHDPVLDDLAVRTRLAAAHVAIVGCGGLGSNVAAILVRAGIRQLTLVDHDVVELSNLNRQLFFADQLGQRKTEALAETLRRIDSGVQLRIIDTRIGSDDVARIAEDMDIVVEALDAADAKAMLVQTLLRDYPDVRVVSASGLAGYGPANEITTEEVADNLVLVGDFRSDIRDGLPLLASRVMIAAAHEAHAVIRIVLGCAIG